MKFLETDMVLRGWLLVVLVMAGCSRSDAVNPQLGSRFQAGGTGVVMHRVAVAASLPMGAPKYSDVCLRYGWIRASFPDVNDAKKAIADFHATRVDWFYPGTQFAEGSAVSQAARAFLTWCHQRGLKVGGAMNTNTMKLAWRLRDGPGSRYIGDPFNVAYVQSALAWGKAQIDAGLDALVCDDFFYYDSKQKLEFSAKVVSPLESYKAGFSVAGNSGSFIGTDFVAPYAFVFHYSDTNFLPSPGTWWQASKAHRALRSTIISHPNKQMSKWTYRTLMALGYATGNHVIMPWDEYIQGGTRFFGDPSDYADVSAFARCLGGHGYLDTYEDAAVGGYDLVEDRYVTAPLSVASGNSQVSLFARAIPGDANAPIVVHLIKWGGKGRSTIRLRTRSFFNGSPLDVHLWTRKPYVKTDHVNAEQTGNFGMMRWDRTPDITVTRSGEWTDVDTPELYSWGVLIVRDKDLLQSDAGALVDMKGDTMTSRDGGINHDARSSRERGLSEDVGVSAKDSSGLGGEKEAPRCEDASLGDSVEGRRKNVSSGGCSVGGGSGSETRQFFLGVGGWVSLMLLGFHLRRSLSLFFL